MMTPDLCEVLNAVLLRDENLKLKAKIAQLETQLATAHKQRELDALNLHDVEMLLKVAQGNAASQQLQERITPLHVDMKHIVLRYNCASNHEADLRLTEDLNLGWKPVHYQGVTVLETEIDGKQKSELTVHYLHVVMERPKAPKATPPQPTAHVSLKSPLPAVSRAIVQTPPIEDPVFDANRVKKHMDDLFSGKITAAEFMATEQALIRQGMERIMSS